MNEPAEDGAIMSFVENLKTEVARLEAELASNPLFMQLLAAKNLLATYTLEIGADKQTTVEQRASVPSAYQSVRKPDSPRSAMLEAAKQFIAGRNYPTPTTEILEALVAQGIEVGGEVPRNSLSSLLSRSEEFKAHGRSGWTLVVLGGDDGEKKLADDANPEVETPSAYVERWSDQPAEPPAQGREAVPGGGT